MTFTEVVILHFPTGWNGVYPSAATDVESSLGGFTWRESTIDVRAPMNSTVITRINLDETFDLESTIELSIMDHFSGQTDVQVPIDVASRLAKLIVAARNAPPPEPLAEWELELLNPNRDSATE